MRTFASVGVAVTAALGPSLHAQAPVARLGPLTNPDPFVNTSIITNDGAGGTVAKIQQCELRSIGGGRYRIAATVNLIDPVTSTALAETSMITGTLDLSVTPPTWAPNQDVAALNQTGTGRADEYQLSLSSDALTAVWDRYIAASFPNS